jgi:hypothetical protein
VLPNDELIAESSRGPAGRAATTGDHEVDLTNEAPPRAADPSAGPPISQCSATLGNPTPEEGDALPAFENSDEELEYWRREDARLEKQRELKRLCNQVLGKTIHQRGESLDALAEPPVPKQTAFAEVPARRATVLPPNYGGHKQKDLTVFIRKVETVSEFDEAVYPTERDRMLFAKQYLVGDAAATWEQYREWHPEVDHTWAAMKELLYGRVALTKHRTDAAFQKLRSAKQGPDQTVTSFGAHIVTTCEGTDITDYNKRMFFWTGLRPEIRAAVREGEEYLTFDACLEAGVEAETALRLDAEYNKAFKCAPKEKAAEKAGKDKGKQRARDDSCKGRSSQGTSQRSRGGFRGRGRGRGRGGHGQGGQQQGDGGGPQGAGTSRRPGVCKACGKFGHLAQDCKTNPPEGSSVATPKSKPSGKEKAP